MVKNIINVQFIKIINIEGGIKVFFKSKAEKEKERMEKEKKREMDIAEKYEYIKESDNAHKICNILVKKFSDLESKEIKKLRGGFTFDINIFYNGIRIVPTQRALLNIEKIMAIYSEEEETITYAELGIVDVPSEYSAALNKYLFEELSKIPHIKVYKGAFGFYIAPGDNIKTGW